MALNPYEILGVALNCTTEDIKKAYKMEAKKHHPDKGGDPSKFNLVKTSYDTLRDKGKRKKYDDYGFFDGDLEMDKNARATEQVLQLFFNIVKHSDLNNIGSLDIVGSIKANINKKTSEYESSMAQLNEAEMKYKKTLKILEKKLKRKGGKPNLLFNALTMQVAQIPLDIVSIKNNIEMNNKMHEIIDEYSYEFETGQALNFFSFGVAG